MGVDDSLGFVSKTAKPGPDRIAMKRRICSYDMTEDPADSYTLMEKQGDIYLRNARCLCLWAVQRATRSNLIEVVVIPLPVESRGGRCFLFLNQ
jgi:hypothetical protein